MIDLIFIPTLKEAEKIFPKVVFSNWKYGILKGKFKNIDVFISGISKSNTSFVSAVVFNETNDVSIAFLMGIAGAYKNSNLQLGELVSVETDYFVDEAMLYQDKLTLTSEMHFPVCEDNRVNFSVFPEIKKVNANTVSLLGANDYLADLYFKKTNADIETMEGAAFGLSAMKFKIKAYQIRAVSNYCGDREKQKWDIKAAVDGLKSFLKLI